MSVFFSETISSQSYHQLNISAGVKKEKKRSPGSPDPRLLLATWPPKCVKAEKSPSKSLFWICGTRRIGARSGDAHRRFLV